MYIKAAQLLVYMLSTLLFDMFSCQVFVPHYIPLKNQAV